MYVYTLNNSTQQYNLTQTLQINSSSVTGYGTDIGEQASSYTHLRALVPLLESCQSPKHLQRTCLLLPLSCIKPVT